MQTIEIEEELMMGTVENLLSGVFMSEPPNDSELPESFPIPDDDPDTKSGEESLPESFPIVEPEPDDTKSSEESLPESFPIVEPEPDDTKS